MQGCVKYLVKWEGYSDEHNSWKLMSYVTNAKQKVKEYHDAHPNFSRWFCKLDCILLNFKPVYHFTEPDSVPIIDDCLKREVMLWIYIYSLFIFYFSLFVPILIPLSPLLCLYHMLLSNSIHPLSFSYS